MSQVARALADALDPPMSRYSHDPLAFVEECVSFRPGERLADYQREILAELPKRRRIAMRSPHGAGKTTLAALIVLWAVLTADDVKVPTTASAWRQLTKYLWPEVHKWSARLRWDRIGRKPFVPRRELKDQSLKPDGVDAEAFAVASNNAALIEGAHARRVVYIFDEAKEIPVSTWDAAEGAFATAGADTTDEAYALAISTPGDTSGRFYDIHRRARGLEDWWPRHVTLEETIKAGRISREWAEQRGRQWGTESAVYQNRVLGEFATSDKGTKVIPLAWVEAANQRWLELREAGKLPDRIEALGADIGRGGDKSSLALRSGYVVTELRRYAVADVMAVTGHIKAALAKGGRGVIDADGIGAGVFDRLREQGVPVQAFHASHTTDARDATGELGFLNARAQAWWNLREILDPANGLEAALPPDEAIYESGDEASLVGDLTAPGWTMKSGGRIQIESKDDIKTLIGRSTDDGDAVVMSFVAEAEQLDDGVSAVAVDTPWG